MIPKELCHYTKKDIALEKILYDREIKLGLIGLTNDPKESQIDMYSMTQPNNYQFSLSELNETNKLFLSIAKEEWKVLCLTKNLPKRKNLDKDFGNVVNQFMPGYNRPRMWAQYAENHTGVCLIFDGYRLHKNINETLKNRCKIFHGSVSYVKYAASIQYRSLEFPDITKNEIRERIGDYFKERIRDYYFENYKSYFLSKYPDWKNESEYRWLVHSEKKSPEFVSIDGALKAVLVGRQFPKVYEPALINICKQLRVSAGRMNWAVGVPYPNFGMLYKPDG